MAAPGNVLVTGAGRGLGLELCRLYERNGWTVFPVVRSARDAGRFDGSGPGECHPVVADLASDEAIGAIREWVSARVDRLDVLINNAGIPGAGTRVASVTPRELRDLLDVHCVGVLRCTQAVLPLLEARKGSKVVNVTSRVGSFARNAAGEFAGEPISYSYRVAKAAQNMLTLCMSQELGPRGVAVCALHPGEFRSGVNPDAEERAGAAAERIAGWLDGLDGGDAGHWHDPRVGRLPW